MKRLTWTQASESGVRWHPGGGEFFFKRPHEGKAQVWRMPIDGGEARVVTHAKEGVGVYRLGGGADHIYYTSNEEATVGDWDWFKKKYKKLHYGSGVWKLARLWKEELLPGGATRDPEKHGPKKLFEGDFHIWQFSVSPDEGRVAVITTPDPRLIRLEGWSELQVLYLETRKVAKVPDALFRQEAPSPYGWIEGTEWSADGGALAFTVSWDGYPTEIYVAHFTDGEGIRVGRVRRTDGPEIEGGTVAWLGKGRDLVYRVQDRTVARVMRARAMDGPASPGAVEQLPSGDGHVWSFSASADGDVLYLVKSLEDRHQDVYVTVLGGDGEAEPERLTDVDPQVATWVLPKQKIVRWAGWNGEEVEGILSLPADWDGSTPLPMITMIHGGPGSASLSCFTYWLSEPIPLYTGKGWAVFRPNYRGSIGYGDEFHEQLLGHKNDRDVADIILGVKKLVSDGVADEERLGANGWSNGGSLTNWLVVTAPDLFRAGASGAGVADFLIQFGLEDTPGHVINYSKGFPWETAELLTKRSPLLHADKVKAAVLFLVGEKDERVPAAHARSFHRSLTYVGAPTELVVFPGEGHGLSKLSHRRAKIELELSWFEKYVLGKDPTPPPAEEEGETEGSEKKEDPQPAGAGGS